MLSMDFTYNKCVAGSELSGLFTLAMPIWPTKPPVKLDTLDTSFVYRLSATPSQSSPISPLVFLRPVPAGIPVIPSDCCSGPRLTSISTTPKP
jgi:hypothetical protein